MSAMTEQKKSVAMQAADFCHHFSEFASIQAKPILKPKY
jgi:hypothetical protein